MRLSHVLILVVQVFVSVGASSLGRSNETKKDIGFRANVSPSSTVTVNATVSFLHIVVTSSPSKVSFTVNDNETANVSPSSTVTVNATVSFLHIVVTSSPSKVSFTVNDNELFISTERGFHIVVINQTDGRLLTHRAFDGDAEKMVSFMFTIQDERIILFAMKVDKETRLTDKQMPERLYLTGLGSAHALNLTVDDQWAMVSQPGVSLLAEIVTKGDTFWKNPVILNVTVAARYYDRPANYGNTCRMLLEDGHFETDSAGWQPYNCKMHIYTQSEARACFKRVEEDNGFKSNLVFIGDSRIRMAFQTLRNYLSGHEITLPQAVDAEYVDKSIGLESKYVFSAFVNDSFVNFFKQWRDSSTPPQVIIAGDGLWDIAQIYPNIVGTSKDDYGFGNYSNKLAELVAPVKALTRRGTRVLWTLQEPLFYERVYFTNRGEQKTPRLTNNNVDMYNAAAVKILQGSDILLWKSFRLIAQGLMYGSGDGMHHGLTTRKYQLQVFLNTYCDKHMYFPEVGTCCSRVKLRNKSNTSFGAMLSHKGQAVQLTSLQTIMFVMLLVWCMVGMAMTLSRLKQWTNGRGDWEEDQTYTAMTSLAKMAAIMAFCWLCDATDLFSKGAKNYTALHFWLPLCGFLVVGVVYNRECGNEAVLNRDQTEEWKGWMQLVILVYHVTGASHVLPVYLHLRAIVSAFLFVTGYGHFCYIWNNGHVTLSRYLQVIFRLNFLTALLCLCLNQPYQNYYYIPLATFWFTVTYIFLALPPRITITTTTTSYIYLAVKFAILWAVISLLYYRTDIFEAVFSSPIWRYLFIKDGDLKEWRFRWELDRYSTLYGMIFASLFNISQKINININSLKSRILILSISIIGLTSFTIFTLNCENKIDCNKVHSYIAFIPIVSFVVLRNVFVKFRQRYSVFFAFIGRISLELFICQYHIWLADDSRSVLLILPGSRLINLILTTVIFVGVSYEVHECTCALVKFGLSRFSSRNSAGK